MPSHFFGCYLLVSRSEEARHRGRTYIGFTVDPNRRIKQHNAGFKSGGAKKTSNRGPWDMLLIVHGFPNEISALRFEWAWQNPQDSRRLRCAELRKNPREKQPVFRLRVLNEMLNSGPWDRLALTIRWLDQRFCDEFPFAFDPPCHMQITSRQMEEKQPSQIFDDHFTPTSQLLGDCSMCMQPFSTGSVNDPAVHCEYRPCPLKFHLICIAKRFLGQEKKFLVPIKGHCPGCFTTMLWGDIVRQLKDIEIGP